MTRTEILAATKLEPQRCELCIFWGRANFGGKRHCTVIKPKRPPGLPASIRYEAQLMAAEDGTKCPTFQRKEVLNG